MRMYSPGVASLDGFYVERVRVGFPVRCASWEQWDAAPQYSGFRAYSGDDGLHVANYVVPRTVSWLGFAINTIFYAAILWLLFAFPSALRRRRRIKRGLCPACAYPTGA